MHLDTKLEGVNCGRMPAALVHCVAQDEVVRGLRMADEGDEQADHQTRNRARPSHSSPLACSIAHRTWPPLDRRARTASILLAPVKFMTIATGTSCLAIASAC